MRLTGPLAAKTATVELPGIRPDEPGAGPSAATSSVVSSEMVKYYCGRCGALDGAAGPGGCDHHWLLRPLPKEDATKSELKSTEAKKGVEEPREEPKVPPVPPPDRHLTSTTTWTATYEEPTKGASNMPWAEGTYEEEETCEEEEEEETEDDPEEPEPRAEGRGPGAGAAASHEGCKRRSRSRSLGKGQPWDKGCKGKSKNKNKGKEHKKGKDKVHKKGKEDPELQPCAEWPDEQCRTPPTPSDEELQPTADTRRPPTYRAVQGKNQNKNKGKGKDKSHCKDQNKGKVNSGPPPWAASMTHRKGNKDWLQDR